jgi:hypothetical protein
LGVISPAFPTEGTMPFAVVLPPWLRRWHLAGGG